MSETFPARWSIASNKAVKQCKALLCQHKRPRWTLLFPSDTAVQVCWSSAEEGTLGLIEHLHLCPPVSSSPTSDSVQRPMPQQNLSQEHFTKSSLALHITPMEVATFNGQNTESTNFLKPRNNLQKCTDLLSAKACERIPVREIICNSITDTDHYKLQQIW